MDYLDLAIQNLIDEGYSITLSPLLNKPDYIEIRLARGQYERDLKVESPKKIIFTPETSYLGIVLTLIRQDFEKYDMLNHSEAKEADI